MKERFSSIGHGPLFILFVSGRRHSNVPSTAHHTTKKTCVTHSSRKKGGGKASAAVYRVYPAKLIDLLLSPIFPFAFVRYDGKNLQTYSPLSLSFSVGYMYTAHTSIYTHTAQKKGCVILRRGCYVVGCYPRLRAWPGVSRNWNVLPLQSAVCVYVYTEVGQNVYAAGLLRIVTCKKRQTVDFFLDITVSSHQIGWLQSRAMYIREFVSRMMDDP